MFVARHGEHELTTVVLSRAEVEELVERMLARAGRRLDRSQPFVDARLPDGSRLHVVIPPITDHWAVNIRKFVGLRANALDELVGVLRSPEAVRSIADVDRDNLAKYLTIAKLRLENAIAIVRTGDID